MLAQKAEVSLPLKKNISTHRSCVRLPVVSTNVNTSGRVCPDGQHVLLKMSRKKREAHWICGMSDLKPFLWKWQEGSFFSLSNIRHFNLKLKTLWLHHCQHTQTHTLIPANSFKTWVDTCLRFFLLLFSSFFHSHALLIFSTFCLFAALLFFTLFPSLSSLFCFSLKLPRFCLLSLSSPPSGSLCLYFSHLFLQMSDSVSALHPEGRRDEKKGGEMAT